MILKGNSPWLGRVESQLEVLYYVPIRIKWLKKSFISFIMFFHSTWQAEFSVIFLPGFFFFFLMFVEPFHMSNYFHAVIDDSWVRKKWQNFCWRIFHLCWNYYYFFICRIVLLKKTHIFKRVSCTKKNSGEKVFADCIYNSNLNGKAV